MTVVYKSNQIAEKHRTNFLGMKTDTNRSNQINKIARLLAINGFCRLEGEPPYDVSKGVKCHMRLRKVIEEFVDAYNVAN